MLSALEPLRPANGVKHGWDRAGLTAAGVWVVGLVVGFFAFFAGYAGLANVALGVAVVAPWVGVAFGLRGRAEDYEYREF